MIWLLGGYMWLFVHRPFEIWTALGTLQIERGYMLLMMLVWCVTPGKGLATNRLHAAMAAFALAMGTTWVLSPYAHTPASSDLVENYFKVVVFYFLVVTTVRTESDLRKLVLLYLGAVSLYMGHSMLEFVNGRYEWRMGTRRMVGVDVTYRDPNAFAAGLLYALALSLPFWAERPRRIPRTLMLGFTAAAFLCILLTGSRSGFLGLFALCAVVVLVTVRRKGTALVLGGLACLAGFVVLSVVLPQDLQDRYLTVVDSSRGPENAQLSAQGRVAGLVKGLESWQESLVVGHGPGSFAQASGTGWQTHSLYGQVLAEMGLMGGLSLVAMLVCFLFNWRETRRLQREAPRWEGGSPPLSYQVSRAVALAVLLMLLLGWAGHNLYRYHWQWFAAFQAVAVYCMRRRAEGEAVEAGAYPMVSHGAPGGSVAPQW